MEWVAIPTPRGLPNLGIEPTSPTLWADSVWSEPPGKPRYFIIFDVMVNEIVSLISLSFVVSV